MAYDDGAGDDVSLQLQVGLILLYSARVLYIDIRGYQRTVTFFTPMALITFLTLFLRAIHQQMLSRMG